MKQAIAKIKLNPGSGGFFDPITRIHLTHGNPIGTVYAGMNVTGLQAASRNRRISVIEGSLGHFAAPFKLVKNKDGQVMLVANKETKQDTKVTEESAPKAKKQVKSEIVKEPKSESVPEPKEAEPVVEEVVIEESKPAEEELTVEVTETTESTAEEVETVEEATEFSNSKKKKKNRGKKSE